eukprot:8547603-Alexandrium_andersonii.AAC.1
MPRACALACARASVCSRACSRGLGCAIHPHTCRSPKLRPTPCSYIYVGRALPASLPAPCHLILSHTPPPNDQIMDSRLLGTGSH